MYFYCIQLNDELIRLSSTGFNWNKNSQVKTSTVDLLMISVETPARAMVQNFVQFNGAHGCSWCETEGKRIPNGEGPGVQTYPYTTNFKNRTNKRVNKRHALKAEEEKGTPHKGVKGRSPFFFLPHFEIVEGCVFDSMHAVDLGVMRQLASLWFS